MCGKIIGGGGQQLYCTYETRTMARLLRRIAGRTHAYSGLMYSTVLYSYSNTGTGILEYYRETTLSRTGIVPVKDSWQIVTSVEVWAFELVLVLGR